MRRKHTRPFAAYGRILCAALALASLAIFAGCGSSGTSSSPAAVGTVKGTVVNTSGGAGIVGVTVTAAGQTFTTNAAGEFTLSSVTAGSSVVVSATKAHFLVASAVIAVTDGQTSEVNFTLRGFGRGLLDLDATVVQTVVDDPNANGLNGSVRLAANSVLDSAGNPVLTYNVEITTALPSDTFYTSFFPGQFMGLATGGATPVPIESFGFVDVTLFDTAGNPLRLDPTKPATITFPIDTCHDPLDATVPIWYLDKASGVWKQEGVAIRDTTVTPNVYKAFVTHLTVWNLDKWFEGGALEVTVKDAAGLTVTGATVTIESNATSGGVWEGRGVTDAAGKVTLAVPAGFLVVQAEKDGLTGGMGEVHGMTTVTVTIRQAGA
jgi:hypothetical protein